MFHMFGVPTLTQTAIQFGIDQDRANTMKLAKLGVKEPNSYLT